MNKTIDGILDEIREKTPIQSGFQYLYRGEPENYPKVSSRLYRDIVALNEKNVIRREKLTAEQIAMGFHKMWSDIPVTAENLLRIQQQELSIARKHKRVFQPNPNEELGLDDADHHPNSREDYSDSDLELLAEIQHLGGSTVLIDFTQNPDIALFFACTGSYGTDARVIIMTDRYNASSDIIPATHPRNRVISQFSQFVLPSQGYLDETNCEIVRIPRELKSEFEKYLNKCKGITDESIYNDIIGYIQWQVRYGQYRYEHAIR